MAEDKAPIRFLDLLRTLIDAGIEFVVVGGVAAVLELETLITSKEQANRAKDRAVLDLLREPLAQRQRLDRG
jgi:hypothetical protein